MQFVGHFGGVFRLFSRVFKGSQGERNLGGLRLSLVFWAQKTKEKKDRVWTWRTWGSILLAHFSGWWWRRWWQRKRPLSECRWPFQWACLWGFQWLSSWAPCPKDTSVLKMLRRDSKNSEIFIATPYCFYCPPPHSYYALDPSMRGRMSVIPVKMVSAQGAPR